MTNTSAQTMLKLEDAFEIGFRWGRCLQGQSVEDSRAVGRTLYSDIFEKLPIDTTGFNSFKTGDDGIIEAKKRILAALRAASAPAAVRETSREQLIRAICGHALCDLQHAQAAADAILALAAPEEASSAAQTHACLTCNGDGYINEHANLPDVKCPDCNGTGRGPVHDSTMGDQYASTAAGEAVDVHGFVQVYNFCFDGGGIYTPTDRDRAMLEDAINCYIAECEQVQADRAAPPTAQTDGVMDERIHLGDIVCMNERAPFHQDWRGVELKVVSLSLDPAGKLWVSVVDSADRINHRGYGAYDGETTGIDACHLSALSRSPQDSITERRP